jgi:hypothetical protein
MSELDARFRRVVGDDAPSDPTELDALRRVVELSAELDDEDRHPASPSESVWAGIAAAVAEHDADAADADAAVDDGSADDEPAGDGPDDAVADDTTTGPRVGGGTVAPPPPGVGDLGAHRARRGRAGPWLLGAAAAVVAVLAGVVGVGLLAGDDEASVVARADLEVLEQGVDPGSARLVDADGRLVLELDAELGPVDGFHEVWLLTPEVDGLVSLGPVRADGRYELPAGVDPERFSVVDVSIEPLDGDPTHSGRSVLRGPLTA